MTQTKRLNVARPSERSCRPLLALACGTLALLTLLPACSGKPKEVKSPPPAPAAPVFTGPKYLYGTVGSLTSVRGDAPALVSGWGFVTNLPGTGSSDVPAFLRPWLINEMRKRGVGSRQWQGTPTSPEELLNSPDTAVVRVEGLMPMGARVGTRFDVLVSALPGTQTTSLEGGQLWTCDLAVGGANTAMAFSKKLAQANGPLYLNPFEDELEAKQRLELQRQAVVLAGGVATVSRHLELLLNQPSMQRCRLIADRINQRYPHEDAAQFFNTAVPRDEQTITLNIPKRFSRDPQRFLELVQRLFLVTDEGFEPQKAQELLEYLITNPDQAHTITLAWEGLGKIILPVLRRAYDHPDIIVRLAALEAGVRLEDHLGLESIAKIAQLPDAQLRIKASELLVHLGRNVRATEALSKLLDDPETPVRIAAYESLAAINDPLLSRYQLGERENFKFILDLVPAKRPLVYVTHQPIPRVVIFNPQTSLSHPLLARLWDNQLMLRDDSSATAPTSGGAQPQIAIYYQPSQQLNPITTTLNATVAELVRYLAMPRSDNPELTGLDLTFSRVASALFLLHRQGALASDFQVNVSPLAAVVAQQRGKEPQELRPETTGTPNTSGAATQPTTTPSDVPGSPAESPPPAQGQILP